MSRAAWVMTAAGRAPLHLPEAHVRIGGSHVPQRPAESGPDLTHVADVSAAGALRQTCRSPRKDEPGHHIGLEPLQLLRRRGRPVLTQLPYDCQRREPEPPRLRPDCGSVGQYENASGILKLRHRPTEHTKEGNPRPRARGHSAAQRNSQDVEYAFCEVRCERNRLGRPGSGRGPGLRGVRRTRRKSAMPGPAQREGGRALGVPPR